MLYIFPRYLNLESRIRHPIPFAIAAERVQPISYLMFASFFEYVREFTKFEAVPSSFFPQHFLHDF